MGNKLKAISKVSVALALLGAAVPAVEAAPTAMAAKKATKKAKKSTKKVVKKSTKKAKKAKKTTKKVAKKTAAKKPAKKAVKKTTKKSVKKVTKKPVAKKPATKPVKKPVAKKPATKVVKKTTTKKPANKAVKHVTMADKYQPKVKSGTVDVMWGTDLYSHEDGSYRPEDFITNRSSLPSDVDFVYLDPVNTKKSGTYKTRIEAKYKDGSKEVVGTVTFVVPKSDTEKYQPTVKDVTLNWGSDLNPRKDAITNAPGYFPNDSAFSQFEDRDDSTTFSCFIDGYENQEFDTTKPGTYNAKIRVYYPDGSFEDTKKFKITVLPSDAEKYKAKLSLKSSKFTVSSDETLEHETGNDDWRLHLTLNDPTRFLNIGSALPEGTIIRFDGDLDSVYTPDPETEYETDLIIHFPDGSEYTTDGFTVYAE